MTRILIAECFLAHFDLKIRATDWTYKLRPSNWRLLAAYDEFDFPLLHDSLETKDDI